MKNIPQGHFCFDKSKQVAQKGFASILAILIIVAIAGGGFYVHKKSQDEKIHKLEDEIVTAKDAENVTLATKMAVEKIEKKADGGHVSKVEEKKIEPKVEIKNTAQTNTTSKGAKTFNHSKGIYSLQYPKDLEIMPPNWLMSTQFGNAFLIMNGDHDKDVNSTVGMDITAVEKELATIVTNKTEEKVTINSRVFIKYTGTLTVTKKDFEYYLLPLEKFDGHSPFFAVNFNNADEFTRQDINLVLNSIKITNSPGEKIVHMIQEDQAANKARIEELKKMNN